MMTSAQRRRFDQVLEDVLAALPDSLRELLEEVPLVVEDWPSAALVRDMKLDDQGAGLCGLHWGVALTQRSVEHSGVLPDVMMIFRGPIFNLAGAGAAGRRGRRIASPPSTSAGLPGSDRQVEDELTRQIRITVLHEIGHHFGLDEDDLERLGYG